MVDLARVWAAPGPHAPTCPPPPCGEGLGVGGHNTTIPRHCLPAWRRLAELGVPALCHFPAFSPHPCPLPIKGRGPCLALSPAITVACSREPRSIDPARNSWRSSRWRCSGPCHPCRCHRRNCRSGCLSTERSTEHLCEYRSPQGLTPAGGRSLQRDANRRAQGAERQPVTEGASPPSGCGVGTRAPSYPRGCCRRGYRRCNQGRAMRRLGRGERIVIRMPPSCR
jgi:hypothetical protein